MIQLKNRKKEELENELLKSSVKKKKRKWAEFDCKKTENYWLSLCDCFKNGEDYFDVKLAKNINNTLQLQYIESD